MGPLRWIITGAPCIPDILCTVQPKALHKRAHVLEPSCVPTRLFQPGTASRPCGILDPSRFKEVQEVVGSMVRWCIVDIGRSGPGMLTHKIDGTTPAANLLSLMHSILLRAADGGFWMNEFCNGPVRGGSSAEAKFAPILEIH
ncbi:hypothetical protein K503DRAFT_318362 [Rhizopogon vinicolor AM-OR11-026]|uniref:Uncharacterized protein n=1 Tax=Rhizopogon vinicolor AM-OR11-026 TaxID=1314800 RepID=A0A1B7NCU1_9AGAM|nr:hypothetical protein K503DRAFT_318362 [Rhizopogon vinicolor AM-OR11-026]